MQSKQFRYILFFSLFALFGVSLAVYAAISFDSAANSGIWYGPVNLPSYTNATATVTLNNDITNFSCPSAIPPVPVPGPSNPPPGGASIGRAP